MSDDVTVQSHRGVRPRDIVAQVSPADDGEPFAIAVTAELERLAEYAQRVRTLLTARHRVDAATAVAWLREAAADDQRIVDLLARLDALQPF